MIARREQHIVADTALDPFTLRPQIHHQIAPARSPAPRP
jgi:hypothetical protein